jgi:hypothetical protein
MPSHRLIKEGDPSNAEWLLVWDDARFVLMNPSGHPEYAADAGMAHRAMDIFALYGHDKITFNSPDGSLEFKKNPAALAELRWFVDVGLGADTEFRRELHRHAKRIILLGLAMFLIAAGLFGLYCWYAWSAPNQPRLNWLTGRFIHWLLLLLLGGTLAGPIVVYGGFRQLRRIRQIERALGIGGSQTN